MVIGRCYRILYMELLSERKAKNFHKLMGEAGDLEVFGAKFPGMQMFTVQNIIEGKRERQMLLLP